MGRISKMMFSRKPSNHSVIATISMQERRISLGFSRNALARLIK